MVMTFDPGSNVRGVRAPLLEDVQHIAGQSRRIAGGQESPQLSVKRARWRITEDGDEPVGLQEQAIDRKLTSGRLEQSILGSKIDPPGGCLTGEAGRTHVGGVVVVILMWWVSLHCSFLAAVGS
jgi:hypothetical protein